MKQKILDFIKAHLPYFIMAIMIILLIVYFVLSVRHISNLAAEYAKLETTNEAITKDRQFLEKENTKLQKEKKIIQHAQDSIIAVQGKQAIQLAQMIKKHKHEIDSLTSLTIPEDSIYKRLQPIYPNYDNDPLNYSFGGCQIRDIYSTAVEYPRIKKEYGLQTNLLQTCNNLNGKYRDSENNYQAQIGNLNKNIADANQQYGIINDQLKLKQKELNHKNFWNWTYKGGLIALAAKIIFFK
jgi:hypothetical protein